MLNLMRQLPEDAENKTVAIVDIGATMTLFSVTKAGKHLYSRDQIFGGEQYTRSIVSYYNKSFEEAEEAKITQDLPPNYTFRSIGSFSHYINATNTQSYSNVFDLKWCR